jgi:hypothetical protein
MLANFAMFLLAAPVQSPASCERIFKNYSAFHTKKRNHLGCRKTYKMTKVKYHLKEKYGVDGELVSGKQKKKKRRNKSVVSDEHKRLEPGVNIEKEDEVEQEKEPAVSGVDDFTEDYGMLPKTAIPEKMDYDSDDSSNMSGGDEVVEGWVEAFDMAEEDKEEAWTMGDESGEDETDKEEEPEKLTVWAFEDRDDHQEEWPDWDTWDQHETFKKWPQEDKKHFAKMKKKWGRSYVRSDKYDLTRLLSYFIDKPEGEDNLDLLPMEAAYGADYG